MQNNFDKKKIMIKRIFNNTFIKKRPPLELWKTKISRTF